VSKHEVQLVRVYRPGVLLGFFSTTVACVCGVAAAAFGLLAAWGVALGAIGSAAALWLVALFFAAVAVSQWRLARSGIWQNPDALVIRSVLRSRRFRADEVTRVVSREGAGQRWFGRSSAPSVELEDGSPLVITWLSSASPHTWGGDRSESIARKANAFLRHSHPEAG